MKKFILILVIAGIQNMAFSQSKILMGGGVIFSEFKNVSIYKNEINAKPFVGFTYEYNFNKNLQLSTNINYSKNVIDSHFGNIGHSDFFESPDVKFVHISVGTSINYKLFSSISKSKILEGFNTGIGFNMDNLRDFKEINLGIVSVEIENKYQLGLLYHLSWDYEKFRLTYNIANKIKMFGNHENLVTGTDWKTISASYIYTFSD